MEKGINIDYKINQLLINRCYRVIYVLCVLHVPLCYYFICLYYSFLFSLAVTVWSRGCSLPPLISCTCWPLVLLYMYGKFQLSGGTLKLYYQICFWTWHQSGSFLLSLLSAVARCLWPLSPVTTIFSGDRWIWCVSPSMAQPRRFWSPKPYNTPSPESFLRDSARRMLLMRRSPESELRHDTMVRVVGLFQSSFSLQIIISLLFKKWVWFSVLV